MSERMYYGDDSVYAVEPFDAVEVRVDGHTFDGQVLKLHPRGREVTVRYRDDLDVTRTTGEPRWKTRRVDVSAVDLIKRDG